MKRFFLTLLWGVLLSSVAGAELRLLPWSENVCRAARFEANSSGRMRITDDPAEKAVRIEVEFPPGADRWVYPYLRLRAPESLAGVERIRFEFRTETEVTCRFAHVMFGEEKPYFKLPAPKTEYQAVTIDVASAVRRPETIAALRIGMNPDAPKLTWFIRNLEFFGTREPARVTDASLAVAAGAPGAAFLQGETLKFRLDPLAARPSRWTLKNWKNETVRQGEWADAELTPDPLPNGYYALELAGFTGDRTFAVVPDPRRRPPNPGLYFAMDSAQSWLARPFTDNPRLVPNAYEAVSELARRAGLRIVRERMHWKETEPAPGGFDWKQYMRNAELLSARGVEVSGMYHNAPAWTKNGEDAMLPADLLATYDFAKKAAETFRGKMTVWEFWNEQDIGFSDAAAWDYAAAMKAAYLGFKAGNPDITVLTGPFCVDTPAGFCRAALKSDLPQYFDVFSYHTYASPDNFPKLLEQIRQVLKESGAPASMPVWFSETGTRAEGPAEAPGLRPGLKEHSFRQELAVAREVPKVLASLQRLGVARAFWFNLMPVNEWNGSKAWGMLRRDYTIKAQYTAFATLTAQLGEAKIEGGLKLPGVRALLYRRADGTQSLLAWSESGAKELRIPGKTARTEAVDLFGTPLEISGGKLVLDENPVYLHGLAGLSPAVPAIPAGTPGAAPTADDKTAPGDSAGRSRPRQRQGFARPAGEACADHARNLQLRHGRQNRDRHGRGRRNGGTLGPRHGPRHGAGRGCAHRHAEDCGWRLPR